MCRLVASQVSYRPQNPLDGPAQAVRRAELLIALRKRVYVQVGTELELSFVMEAEMVFTTLSSTGRRVFQRLPPNAFETVLIDEAAQASEIAALQPLTFGSKR